MSGRSSTSDLNRLLSVLFPEGGEGFVELRTLPGGVQAFVRPGDTAAVESFVTDHHTKNLYVGVASRRTATSGALSNCGEVRALWVDIDFKDTSGPEADMLLSQFELPPSVVVSSGGGQHVYWLLQDPVDVQRDEARTRLVLRALAERV